jgi:hypothetical protein
VIPEKELIGIMTTAITGRHANIESPRTRFRKHSLTSNLEVESAAYHPSVQSVTPKMGFNHDVSPRFKRTSKKLMFQLRSVRFAVVCLFVIGFDKFPPTCVFTSPGDAGFHVYFQFDFPCSVSQDVRIDVNIMQRKLRSVCIHEVCFLRVNTNCFSGIT